MALDLITQLRDTFWDEVFWTPPNTTWALYETANYRHFNDFYYCIFTAFALLLVRHALDWTIFSPIGRWCGLRSTRRLPAPVPNPELERTFRQTHGKIVDKALVGLAKRVDLSEREVQRWMRARLAQTRPTVLTKFTETFWRGTFYLSLFIYGLVILWDKPWMWDSVYCFLDYPHHTVTPDQWWYYNIESAFYLSLIFSQFFDVQRKDFWLMFIHHFVTLLLLSFSWACNLVRIGTLVIVIHDFADIPLEFGKLLAYLKLKWHADMALVCFAIFWTVSRLVILPYRIIYYSSIVAPRMLPMFNAYYFFNGLLLALQGLHIIWTYYIVVAAINTMKSDAIKDMRSDDEEDEDGDQTDDELETTEESEKR